MTARAPEQLEHELSQAYGRVDLVRLQHPRQANHTWMVEWDHGPAIVKQYRWIGPDALTEILQAEQRARAAGVPVPEVLHRCEDGLTVVYTLLGGRHVIPLEAGLVDHCAELYAAQLSALADFHSSTARPRPQGLTRRAQEAYDGSADQELRQVIATTWAELSRLGSVRPVGASHMDWRADNLLVNGSRVSGVVDWEFLGPLPAAEAVGCAAGSLTHSWRDELYRPMTVEPVQRFLQTAAELLSWTESDLAHARLAALHTCAIRLAEDRSGGGALYDAADLKRALA
ncbi:phosphotransferase [Kribbella sp. CA-253562]|uniref:phosphotransferase n=1 Tax=Kribbella sp. CA-253562 TaxID=3239942 RepID=UPI003D921107